MGLEKPLFLRRDDTWKDYGNCASVGPHDALWFPERGYPQPTKVARTCANCWVQYECLTYALNTPSADDFGWWAGSSEKDRQILRRQGTPAPRVELITDTATPETRTAARRHAADGRSIAWISYALRLTGPAVRAALRDKTKAAA